MSKCQLSCLDEYCVHFQKRLTLSMYIMYISVGIRTLKVDGRSNDSTAKHPSLGNCYHLMPADCYLHRVHQ